MTDFQVGDRVSVEGVVTGTQMDFDAMRETTMVQVKSGGEVELYCSDLTLVERPRRKLRVGSVWEREGYQRVAIGGGWFCLLGSSPRDTSARRYEHRADTDFDLNPELWREVPVEELGREAT